MDIRNEPESTLPPIGPYRLLRLIGEGGMGAVYEAEQQVPVKRRVALKVIKIGMDTRQVVARFEAERQALAVMSHPNIARMLDAGTTDEGRPYFVMELVKGEPLTDYCDRLRLTTAERAELFLQVLTAVQHAHLKGVVHRDLKPSNILVDTTGARPLVKVIDFGIAKAVDQRVSQATRVTQLGHMVGTPAYMSPEQAEQSELDVDARTDVYSLGVVLYELLAGSLPFDKGMFARPDFVFQYLLRDTEAPTPSARFASLAHTQITVAERRRTDVRSLRRQLSGDLDWIVMKAMEKSRGRRYETPSAFAEDVERFLRGEPVVARPPTLGYRTARFVRRHRWGVGFAALLGGLLVGGSAVLSVQAARLAEERDAARELAGFLERLFEATDPYQEGRRDTLNISQFVRLSAERVRTELDDEPHIQARLLVLMGKVFRNLGRFGEARELLEEGTTIFATNAAEDSEEVVGSRAQLASVLRDVGEPAAAAELFESVVAARRARTDSASVEQLGASLLGLGNARQDQGDYAAAEAAYAEGLERLAEVLAEDDPKMLQAMNNLGTVRVRRADMAGAEEAFRSAYETGVATLGEDHPLPMSFAGNLAFVLRETHRYEEAAVINLRQLELSRERFPGNLPLIARILNNLGAIYLDAKDPERALPFAVEAVELRTESLGPDHPDVATSMVNLGSAWMDLGHTARADSILKVALRSFERAYGEDHPRVAGTLVSLGTLAHEAGDHASARDRLRRAEAIRVRLLGEDHPNTASVRVDLGRDLLELGETQEARAMLTAAYRVLRGRAEEDGARLRLALGYLMDVSIQTGDGAEAARYQAELAALSPT